MDSGKSLTQHILYIFYLYIFPTIRLLDIQLVSWLMYICGIKTIGSRSCMYPYCRMPARRGLRRTVLAPGRDETRASDPYIRLVNTD